MRRRRKKNPLLTKILLVSIAAHAIALPIAAHFGAFDKLQKQFAPARVVMINTPPLEEKKAEKAKPEKKRESKTRTAAKHSNASAQRRSGPAKPNPFQPKVVTTQGDAGDGATADPNGTGKAGEVPTAPSGGTPTTKPAETTAPVNTAPATKQPPVEETHPVAEIPKPPAASKPKRIVQAEQVFAPEPEIPDDLRSEPLDKTLLVEADVSADGATENVHVTESTGIRELDDVGISTAKKYRFKPATVDDAPVESHVRFRVIFKVEG